MRVKLGGSKGESFKSSLLEQTKLLLTARVSQEFYRKFLLLRLGSKEFSITCVASTNSLSTKLSFESNESSDTFSKAVNLLLKGGDITTHSYPQERDQGEHYHNIEFSRRQPDFPQQQN